MEDNKRRTIKKRIQEVQIGRRIPGTDIIAREYWDHMLNDNRDQGEGLNDRKEDPFANPDVLDSEESPYYRPLTAEGELMLQAVQETMAELTPQQQAIIRLSQDGVWSEKAGQLIYTEQAIVEMLGISRRSVRECLNRAKAKIRRRYEKLKTMNK